MQNLIIFVILTTTPMQKEKLEKAALAWTMVSIPPASAIHQLTQQVPSLHPLIAEILVKRQQTSLEAVKSFMTPGSESLDNIAEMKDLAKATTRIETALGANEKILIYGDYDVDGTCSTAMMYSFLKSIDANVEFYNPDRYTEGYGISATGIDYASENNFSLVIALDCGVTAVEQIGNAKERGIDFIVCDHHLPGPVLPAAVALLNPKQEDCGLYGEELCGCGVAFVLIKHLCAHMNLPEEAWRVHLPLVAIATCCDIVDLTGLNRSLVKAGLDALNAKPPAGVAAMLQKAAYTGMLDVSDVVFKLGPRINAAGRLDHARIAVNLLIQNNLAAAMPYAETLEQLNRERRVLDKDITAEAVEMMYANDPKLEKCSTVVMHRDWHKGVVGIVASRLTEVCYRPTVVFTENHGTLTGSARSVVGFNLYEAVKACSHLLTNFGGHHSAAGLGLDVANYEAFCESFEAAVAATITGDCKQPSLSIDIETDFDAWHNARFHTFLNQLNRLKPFGPKNAEPLFATRNCLASDVRVVGSDHLKFKVYQEGDFAQRFEVIAFGFGHLYERMAAGEHFDLAYHMGSNTWNGQSTFQLEAKDIKMPQLREG